MAQTRTPRRSRSVRPSRAHAAEREFGLLVGGVLLALATWWTVRDKFETGRPVVFVLGGALAVLGLLAPALLRGPNRWWLRLGEGLGFVSTRVVLALVFFLIVTPIGLVKRLTGWDPLRRRSEPGDTYWSAYSSGQRNLEHYEKMW